MSSILPALPDFMPQGATIRKRKSKLTPEELREALWMALRLAGNPLHLLEKKGREGAMKTTYSPAEASKRAFRRSRSGGLEA